MTIERQLFGDEGPVLHAVLLDDLKKAVILLGDERRTYSVHPLRPYMIAFNCIIWEVYPSWRLNVKIIVKVQEEEI